MVYPRVAGRRVRRVVRTFTGATRLYGGTNISNIRIRTIRRNCLLSRFSVSFCGGHASRCNKDFRGHCHFTASVMGTVGKGYKDSCPMSVHCSIRSGLGNFYRNTVPSRSCARINEGVRRDRGTTGCLRSTNCSVLGTSGNACSS